MCTMMSAVQRMRAKLSITSCTYGSVTLPLTGLLPLVGTALELAAGLSHAHLGYPAKEGTFFKVIVFVDHILIIADSDVGSMSQSLNYS